METPCCELQPPVSKITTFAEKNTKLRNMKRYLLKRTWEIAVRKARTKLSCHNWTRFIVYPHIMDQKATCVSVYVLHRSKMGYYTWCSCMCDIDYFQRMCFWRCNYYITKHHTSWGSCHRCPPNCESRMRPDIHTSNSMSIYILSWEPKGTPPRNKVVLREY